MWREILGAEEQEGTRQLCSSDGVIWDAEYAIEGGVLPGIHFLFLKKRTDVPGGQAVAVEGPSRKKTWVHRHALLLLDPAGLIVSWSVSATRLYGYGQDEAMGRHVSFLSLRTQTGPLSGGPQPESSEKTALERCAAEGRFGNEGWQLRKDGSQFWANGLSVAMKDEEGRLHGFARVVRDFSENREGSEKPSRSRVRAITPASTIAGIVSGEFDRILEANDSFLSLIGYTREDVLAGRLHWSQLTPIEYASLDDVAHEECLRYGASTPYEKELMRGDGTRVAIVVTTAILDLARYRWLTFVQDLRNRERDESIAERDGEGTHGFEEMVGNSAVLRRIIRQIEVVAPTDANVLILGETGTGKELVARAIHRLSPRRDLPFITLNCAAIPTGLLESELFGYEKGAFTGALGQKLGRFELAHRGTLFLDEVGDIPLELQPKLLRALQEKSFERLGGVRTIPIDVRLVAATNRNLTEMMGDKLFRSDLYYRLKVFPITTPALRDHPEDIPILARHFTRIYARKMGKEIRKIPPETMRALESWTWPGNVRELENFIERAVILSQGSNLRAPISEIRSSCGMHTASNTLEQVEREHVLRVLRETGGVISVAAIRLGMPRTTLNALMRKLGLSRKDI
jgi:PAS domain S-box-containing protein